MSRGAAVVAPDFFNLQLLIFANNSSKLRPFSQEKKYSEVVQEVENL